MPTLTATLTLNIDDNEYQKTVTFTPNSKGLPSHTYIVCERANELIRPLEKLEEEVLRQSLNKDYAEWMKKCAFKIKADQQN